MIFLSCEWPKGFLISAFLRSQICSVHSYKLLLQTVDALLARHLKERRLPFKSQLKKSTGKRGSFININIFVSYLWIGQMWLRTGGCVCNKTSHEALTSAITILLVVRIHVTTCYTDVFTTLLSKCCPNLNKQAEEPKS